MSRSRSAAVFLALALAGCGSENAPAPAQAEAGFIELEPVDYAVHGTTAIEVTSSRARLFFDFHPADSGVEKKPLVVLYNGGPGASTAILLGGNTAPVTLDPARTGPERFAPNPASWTAFANVLHIDARGTGFSYGLVESADVGVVRAGEMTVRNFNSFLDAADIVRVVLRFLKKHPALRASRVVLAGESYGGIRSEVALHMLHHPQSYSGPGALYQDEALVSEMAHHFEEAGTTPTTQFDRTVLLQPRLFSPNQQAAAGAALEQPGSFMWAIAEQVQSPFAPCFKGDSTCSPYSNALAFLQLAGRDIYDVRKPDGYELQRYADIGARFEDVGALQQALGVDPSTVDLLQPPARGEAYRLVTNSIDGELLQGVFGPLPPYDRYFQHELFDQIGAPFAGTNAQSLGIERQHQRYGRLFLEDLLTTRAFVSNAVFDATIFTPSLPAALAMYTDLVTGVHKDGDAIAIDYKPGAFGAPQGTQRSLRFVTYELSGHSVTLDEPEKLASDVAAWLAETE